MHAVLLAAGRSQRLGDLTRDLPKCLLEVGGRPLITYSLENLVRGGVREITIVTGHCDGSIQTVLGDDFLGAPVRYRFNPDYAQTGSVISLLIGAAAVEAPQLLVVESDLLYHPKFVEPAMTAAEDTIIVADASGSGDEVYICAAPDGRLSYLGKGASAPLRRRSLGEFAGISRLSAGLCRSYMDQARRLQAEGKAGGHYEELIFALAQAGHNFRVRHCPSLPWTEVDTPDDLERARTKIYPQLQHLWAGNPEVILP